MANYDRLTALDSSFLFLEKPNSYTHVASTQIFETGPLRLEDGAVLWQMPVPACPLRWGIAIDREGRVIVSLRDGTVLCFG